MSSSLLESLRRNAAILTPEEFLAHHPGAWVQYFDDTPAKDPAKALSAPAFDRATGADRMSLAFASPEFQLN